VLEDHIFKHSQFASEKEDLGLKVKDLTFQLEFMKEVNLKMKRFIIYRK